MVLVKLVLLWKAFKKKKEKVDNSKKVAEAEEVVGDELLYFSHVFVMRKRK